MWLHWLQPDEEARDCDFCREHEHYSFTNPDPAKAGKPIIERGQVRRRGRKDVPQCGICPATGRWTVENLAIYRRWRFRALGLSRGPADARTAWGFFLLDETAREIEQHRAVRAVCMGIARAFGDG